MLKIQNDVFDSYCYFSIDKKYRYVLYRKWNSAKPPLVVIGLNPSIANEQVDDNTVRKCITIARLNGYGELVMLNAFAIIGSNPDVIHNTCVPIGQFNDTYILSECVENRKIVVAWGRDGESHFRGFNLRMLLRHIDLYCFGKNKDSSPKHPLYLPLNTRIILYREKVD